MAAGIQYRVNTFRLGFTVFLPVLIDVAYHEAYLTPTNIPNFWTNERLEGLTRLPKELPFHIPPALTFTGYHTENPRHADYIYAKKSLWRYKLAWSVMGVVASGMQLHYLINSVRVRWVFGAVKAVGAFGFMWTVLILEGNSRRMFIDAMKERVMEEEKAFE